MAPSSSSSSSRRRKSKDDKEEQVATYKTLPHHHHGHLGFFHPFSHHHHHKHKEGPIVRASTPPSDEGYVSDEGRSGNEAAAAAYSNENDSSDLDDRFNPHGETEQGQQRDYAIPQRASTVEDSDDTGKMTDYSDPSGPPSRAPSPPPPQPAQQQPSFRQAPPSPSVRTPFYPPPAQQGFGDGISRPSTAPIVPYSGGTPYSSPPTQAFIPSATSGPPPPTNALPGALNGQPNSTFRPLPNFPQPVSPPPPQLREPPVGPMSTAQEMMMNMQWMRSNPAPASCPASIPPPQPAYQQPPNNLPPASPNSPSYPPYSTAPPLQAYFSSSPPPAPYSPPPRPASIAGGPVPYAAPPGPRFEPQAASQDDRFGPSTAASSPPTPYSPPPPRPASVARAVPYQPPRNERFEPQTASGADRFVPSSTTYSAPVPYPGPPPRPASVAGAVPYAPTTSERFEPRLSSQQQGREDERFRPSLPPQQPREQRSYQQPRGDQYQPRSEQYPPHEQVDPGSRSDSGGSDSSSENAHAGPAFQPVAETRTLPSRDDGRYGGGGRGGQGRPLPGAFPTSPPPPPRTYPPSPPPANNAPPQSIPSFSSAPPPPVEPYRPAPPQQQQFSSSPPPPPRALPGAFIPRPSSAALPVTAASPPRSTVSQPNDERVQPYQPDWQQGGRGGGGPPPAPYGQSTLPGAFLTVPASSNSSYAPQSQPSGPPPPPLPTSDSFSPSRDGPPSTQSSFSRPSQTFDTGATTPYRSEAPQQQPGPAFDPRPENGGGPAFSPGREEQYRPPPPLPPPPQQQPRYRPPPQAAYSNDGGNGASGFDGVPSPAESVPQESSIPPPPSDYHTDSDGEAPAVPPSPPASRPPPTSFDSPPPPPPFGNPRPPRPARSARRPPPFPQAAAFAASSTQPQDEPGEPTASFDQGRRDGPPFQQQAGNDAGSVDLPDPPPRRTRPRAASVASANLSDENYAAEDEAEPEEQAPKDDNAASGYAREKTRRPYPRAVRAEERYGGQDQAGGTDEDGDTDPPPRKPISRRRRRRGDVPVEAQYPPAEEQQSPPPPLPAATATNSDEYAAPVRDEAQPGGDEGYGSDEETDDRKRGEQQGGTRGGNDLGIGEAEDSYGQDSSITPAQYRPSRSDDFTPRPRSARFPRHQSAAAVPPPPSSNENDNYPPDPTTVPLSRNDRDRDDNFAGEDPSQKQYQDETDDSFAHQRSAGGPFPPKAQHFDPPSSDEEYGQPGGGYERGRDGEHPVQDRGGRGERPFEVEQDPPQDPSYLDRGDDARLSSPTERQPDSLPRQQDYGNTDNDRFSAPQPAFDSSLDSTYDQDSTPSRTYRSSRRAPRPRDDENDDDRNGSGSFAAAGAGLAAGGLASAGAYSAYSATRGDDQALRDPQTSEDEWDRSGGGESSGGRAEGRNVERADDESTGFGVGQRDEYGSNAAAKSNTQPGYDVATDSDPYHSDEGYETDNPRSTDKTTAFRQPQQGGDYAREGGDTGGNGGYGGESKEGVDAYQPASRKVPENSSVPAYGEEGRSQDNFGQPERRDEYDGQVPRDSQDDAASDNFQPKAQGGSFDDAAPVGFATDSEDENVPKGGRGYSGGGDEAVAGLRGGGAGLMREDGRGGDVAAENDSFSPASTPQAEQLQNDKFDSGPSTTPSGFSTDVRQDPLDQENDSTEKPGASLSDDEMDGNLDGNDKKKGYSDREDYNDGQNDASTVAAGVAGGAALGAAGAYGASKAGDEGEDPDNATQAVPYQSKDDQGGSLSDDELNAKKNPSDQDGAFDPVGESSMKPAYDNSTGGTATDAGVGNPGGNNDQFDGAGKNDPFPSDNASYGQDRLDDQQQPIGDNGDPAGGAAGFGKDDALPQDDFGQNGGNNFDQPNPNPSQDDFAQNGGNNFDQPNPNSSQDDFAQNGGNNFDQPNPNSSQDDFGQNGGNNFDQPNPNSSQDYNPPQDNFPQGDSFGNNDQSYPPDSSSYGQDSFSPGAAGNAGYNDGFSGSNNAGNYDNSGGYDSGGYDNNGGYNNGFGGGSDFGGGGDFGSGMGGGGANAGYGDDGRGWPGEPSDYQPPYNDGLYDRSVAGYDQGEQYPPEPEYSPPSPGNEPLAAVVSTHHGRWHRGRHYGHGEEEHEPHDLEEARQNYEARMHDLDRLHKRRPRPPRSEIIAAAQKAVGSCTRLRFLEDQHGEQDLTPLPTARDLGLNDSEYHSILRQLEDEHRKELELAKAAYEEDPESEINRRRLAAADAQHGDLGHHASGHAEDLRDKHEALLTDPNATTEAKNQAAQARHVAAAHEVKNASAEVKNAEQALEDLHRQGAHPLDIKRAEERVRSARSALAKAKEDEEQARHHLPRPAHRDAFSPVSREHNSHDPATTSPEDRHLASVKQVHVARDKVEAAEDLVQRTQARFGANHPETLQAKEKLRMVHAELQSAKQEEASLRGSVGSQHRLHTADLARRHAQEAVERREAEIREIESRGGPKNREEKERLEHLHGSLALAKTRLAHAEGRHQREEEAHFKSQGIAAAGEPPLPDEKRAPSETSRQDEGRRPTPDSRDERRQSHKEAVRRRDAAHRELLAAESAASLDPQNVQARDRVRKARVAYEKHRMDAKQLKAGTDSAHRLEVAKDSAAEADHHLSEAERRHEPISREHGASSPEALRSAALVARLRERRDETHAHVEHTRHKHAVEEANSAVASAREGTPEHANALRAQAAAQDRLHRFRRDHVAFRQKRLCHVEDSMRRDPEDVKLQERASEEVGRHARLLEEHGLNGSHHPHGMPSSAVQHEDSSSPAPRVGSQESPAAVSAAADPPIPSQKQRHAEHERRQEHFENLNRLPLAEQAQHRPEHHRAAVLLRNSHERKTLEAEAFARRHPLNEAAQARATEERRQLKEMDGHVRNLKHGTDRAHRVSVAHDSAKESERDLRRAEEREQSGEGSAGEVKSARRRHFRAVAHSRHQSNKHEFEKHQAGQFDPALSEPDRRQAHHRSAVALRESRLHKLHQAEASFKTAQSHYLLNKHDPAAKAQFEHAQERLRKKRAKHGEIEEHVKRLSKETSHEHRLTTATSSSASAQRHFDQAKGEHRLALSEGGHDSPKTRRAQHRLQAAESAHRHAQLYHRHLEAKEEVRASHAQLESLVPGSANHDEAVHRHHHALQALHRTRRGKLEQHRASLAAAEKELRQKPGDQELIRRRDAARHRLSKQEGKVAEVEQGIRQHVHRPGHALALRRHRSVNHVALEKKVEEHKSGVHAAVASPEEHRRAHYRDALALVHSHQRRLEDATADVHAARRALKSHPPGNEQSKEKAKRSLVEAEERQRRVKEEHTRAFEHLHGLSRDKHVSHKERHEMARHSASLARDRVNELKLQERHAREEVAASPNDREAKTRLLHLRRSLSAAEHSHKIDSRRQRHLKSKSAAQNSRAEVDGYERQEGADPHAHAEALHRHHRNLSSLHASHQRKRAAHTAAASAAEKRIEAARKELDASPENERARKRLVQAEASLKAARRGQGRQDEQLAALSGEMEEHTRKMEGHRQLHGSVHTALEGRKKERDEQRRRVKEEKREEALTAERVKVAHQPRSLFHKGHNPGIHREHKATFRKHQTSESNPNRTPAQHEAHHASAVGLLESHRRKLHTAKTDHEAALRHQQLHGHQDSGSEERLKVAEERFRRREGKVSKMEDHVKRLSKKTDHQHRSKMASASAEESKRHLDHLSKIHKEAQRELDADPSNADARSRHHHSRNHLRHASRAHVAAKKRQDHSQAKSDLHASREALLKHKKGSDEHSKAIHIHHRNLLRRQSHIKTKRESLKRAADAAEKRHGASSAQAVEARRKLHRQADKHNEINKELASHRDTFSRALRRQKEQRASRRASRKEKRAATSSERSKAERDRIKSRKAAEDAARHKHQSERRGEIEAGLHRHREEVAKAKDDKTRRHHEDEVKKHEAHLREHEEEVEREKKRRADVAAARKDRRDKRKADRSKALAEKGSREERKAQRRAQHSAASAEKKEEKRARRLAIRAKKRSEVDAVRKRDGEEAARRLREEQQATHRRSQEDARARKEHKRRDRAVKVAEKRKAKERLRSQRAHERSLADARKKAEKERKSRLKAEKKRRHMAEQEKRRVEKERRRAEKAARKRSKRSKRHR